MGATWSIENEADRQISLLRCSNMRLCLMSISAPHLAAGILNDAMTRAAGDTNLVGILADASVGVLSAQAEDHSHFEQHFITRLNAQLRRIQGDGATGHVWVRSVQCRASDLGASSDLLDVLFDSPPVPVVVGMPTQFDGRKRSAVRPAGNRMPAPAVARRTRNGAGEFAAVPNLTANIPI